MKRYIIVFIVLIVILIGGMLFFSFPAPSSQEPQQSVPLGSNGSTQTVVSTQQSSPEAQAVRAAYQQALSADGDPDNIKPYKTAVAGSYALQAWVGDHTGGEALLKFDSVQNKWSIVDPGGGEWSVGGLVQFGVPTTTAEALLADLLQ